ncbi:flagellar hook protein FlgE [Succinivibrio dextrinosolvens DSM 3072]|uniref:Flagellar hook protein FlgE n=1 Tax=Succinivibrio dextrinosolvens DSM 3072 TaxID=1123324 RepID=A0A1T4VBD9_9GAMM|nr:flagellar hook protein FlgE [Succinivibrio dextrinosolvens]SKA62282.1 flagellar hook protein FlgE [Succinivibrio dextrinosolvens DSM 3072]
MFNTSISGIRGSQKYLDTTSNNIANANSYGFKKSRAEFADIYANSVFTSAKTATGMGVTTTTVAQQFTQGSLSGDTGNNLDMAISGNGFFVLANNENYDTTSEVGDRSYTRNGAFELNKDGFIVTAMGDYLQGYDVDKDGNVTNLDIMSTHAIKIPSDTGAPKQSSKAELIANLPAKAEAHGKYAADFKSTTSAMTSFDPNNSETYTAATSQTIYDSLGGAHTLTYYFQKDHTNPSTTSDPLTGVLDTPDATVWNVVLYVDGSPVDVHGGAEFNITDTSSSIYPKDPTLYGIQLVFASNGSLVTDETTGDITGQIPGSINITNIKSEKYKSGDRATYSLSSAMGSGVDPSQDLNIQLDLSQYGSSKFSVTSVSTDGYATGILENVEVDDNGIILAAYTNGRTQPISKVAMATFSNPQGLIKIGDTQWKQSINSGEATAAQANVGMAGAIKGANLELSNVELASELVDLLIAQRTYQANAQALQTQNTAMDSILSIR